MTARKSAGRSKHDQRAGRESMSKKLGKVGKQIAARDCWRCVYCGNTKESSGSHLQYDHLTPRSHGGTDDAPNLVLACRRCNSARQAMTLGEFSRYANEVYKLKGFTARSIRSQARRTLPAYGAVLINPRCSSGD